MSSLPHRTLLSCALLLASACVSATASAATFSPTRSDDPPPNGCSPNDCSLREAVIAANGTAGPDLIQLAPVTYALSLNGNDTDVTGDLDIRSDLVMRGPATIDAQSLGRIMEIEDEVNVVLEDLVLENANTSLATNGTLSGGAVQIEGGRLTVRSSVFRDNRVQSQGAGIYTLEQAVLVVEDSVFFDNEASSGAGIFANGDVTVRNTRFESNDAAQRGAALYLAGTTSDVELRQVSLLSNESDGSSGGAILFLGRSLAVDDLLAVGNLCLEGIGGVLAVTGTAHAKSLRISNAIFADNRAEAGGVLYLADDEDPMEIAHATFVDNVAERQGGAVYSTGGLIDVANATFSGNTAGTDGGAIYLFGMDLALRHVTITGGSANRGSALYIGGSSAISSASLANSIIEGNCSLQSSGTLASLGGNVESPGDSCALNQASDQVNVSAPDLGLEARQDTAGASPSHPLAGDSVARGAGLPATCAALPSDQLFQPRLSACDAGALAGGLLLANGFETVPTLGSTR